MLAAMEDDEAGVWDDLEGRLRPRAGGRVGSGRWAHRGLLARRRPGNARAGSHLDGWLGRFSRSRCPMGRSMARRSSVSTLLKDENQLRLPWAAGFGALMVEKARRYVLQEPYGGDLSSFC